jgi:hypothetical protein
VKVLLNIPTPFLCGRVQATRRIRPGSRDDLSRELAQALPASCTKFIVALWLARLSCDGVKTEAAGQGATVNFGLGLGWAEWASDEAGKILKFRPVEICNKLTSL